MDARAMEFKDGTFDCVIDKATLDSILVIFILFAIHDLKCGENSMSNCASYLSEIHRVLTPKGVFICVSYGTPENREIYLKKVSVYFSA